jgi:hypothetical protein
VKPCAACGVEGEHRPGSAACLNRQLVDARAELNLSKAQRLRAELAFGRLSRRYGALVGLLRESGAAVATLAEAMGSVLARVSDEEISFEKLGADAVEPPIADEQWSTGRPRS